jgi:hypothetical protein
MTEIAMREQSNLATYADDPTGGRLVAWAQAASAANQLAKALVSTTFVPAAFKGNVGDATAVILMGDELGLSPLASLRSIYAVHGTPALYARTMVALAQAHGHEVWTETDTPAKVVVCGRRKGSDKIERSEWTIDRARKAGYTNNKKYDSNPQEMLYAKAASVVARKVAADVLAGVPHSVEDLELEEPADTTTVKREPAKARRTRPLAAVAEPDLEPELTPAGDDKPDQPDDGNPDAITAAQMKKLQAHYKDIPRDVRLGEAGDVLGHDVESFSALTKDEASTVIDYIENQPEPTE